MNITTLKEFSIVGILVIFLLAALWHFMYAKVPTPFVGIVSPVNESPFEHAKLFFIPAILFFIVEYIAIGHEFPNYLFAHSIALLLMPIFMLLFYSLYSPYLERTLLLDVLNAFLTTALGVVTAYYLTISDRDFSRPIYTALAVLIPVAMLLLYAVFTFYPPKAVLFLDKNTGKYGI